MIGEQQQVSTPHLTAAIVLDLPTFNPPGFQSAASLPCSAHSAAVKCTRQQARSVARAAATQTYPVLWGLQLATVSIYCPCSPTQLARANTLHVGRASTAKMGPCRSLRLGRSSSMSAAGGAAGKIGRNSTVGGDAGALATAAQYLGGAACAVAGSVAHGV